MAITKTGTQNVPRHNDESIWIEGSGRNGIKEWVYSVMLLNFECLPSIIRAIK
jgi:hypothetical protein